MRKRKKKAIIKINKGKASKCKVCKQHSARLHISQVMDKTGHLNPHYYVDCECGQGCITGWYDTEEEAIAAWNNGIEVI